MTTKTKAKVEATLNSKNFFVSLISLSFLIIGTLSGEPVPEDASKDLLDALTAKDLELIAMIIIPNFIKPLLKLIKEKRFSWDFLKNKNIQTQLMTVLLLGIAGAGIAFPDGAVANIMDSFAGGELSIAALAILINFINPIYHFFFDKPIEGVSEMVVKKN